MAPYPIGSSSLDTHLVGSQSAICHNQCTPQTHLATINVPDSQDSEVSDLRKFVVTQTHIFFSWKIYTFCPSRLRKISWEEY